MYCKNCGSKLETKDAFCYVCGTKTEFSSDFVEKDKIISTNMDTKNLVNNYIGVNQDKIEEDKFSFPTLFLGPLYLIYRKLYFVAFIWIIASIIAKIFIPEYAWIILISFSIIFAIYFNKFYLETVKNRVEKIKNQNSKKSNEEIIKLVKSKGGTNVIGIILIIFVFLIIFLVAIFFFAVSDITNEIINEIETEIPKYNVEDENLSYVIPRQFEVESITDYHRKYSYYGADSSCSLKIQNTKSSYYDSIEEYLNYNVYTRGTDKVSKIEEETINNDIWLHQVTENSYSVKHYYASENNEKLFLIEFDIMKDDNRFCSSSHQFFINSLRFKNNSSSKNDL